MITFPDVFTQVIYEYLILHDDEIILYKNIMNKYKMSYPTIRSRIKWLEERKYIKKNKRRITIIPHF